MDSIEPTKVILMCNNDGTEYQVKYKEEPGEEPLVGNGNVCAVCGDKATRFRYSHYGTTSCFSCRAFFRRTVKKSKHEIFYCKTGKCEVNVRTRKKCPYCRFKKCKEVGMTYNNVDDTNVPIPRELFEARQRELAEIKCIKKPKLSPGPKQNNPTKSLTVVNDGPEEMLEKRGSFTVLLKNTIDEEMSNQINLDQSQPTVELTAATSTSRTSCIVSNPNSSVKIKIGNAALEEVFPSSEFILNNSYEDILNIPTHPHLKFTTEERARVEHLLTLEKSNIISFNEMEYDVAAKVIKEMFDKAFSSSTMDYELIFWGYTFAIKKITWFAQAIQEFSICAIEDKKNLLLQNLDPMFNIKAARFFQGAAKNLYEQLNNFSVFDTQHLNKTDNSSEAPTLQWNQFFRTPWANSVEHEKKYEIFMNRSKELDIDERVGCLLQVVALFASDGAVLLNTQQVAKTQESFCYLLFRFLIDRDGEESAKEKIPKYISILKDLREMADIMRNQTLKL